MVTKGLHKPLLNIFEAELVHLEASTYCNARCPQCVRNLCGWNVVDVVEQHLQVDVLAGIMSELPRSITTVFNGNYGDPMMNPHIVDLVKLCPSRTSVTTNGSIGKIETFIELAMLGVEICFSIDGLHDTNHIYRQDVDWNKIMERASAFIDAGGIAHWKFVIFKHNAHQVRSADVLSQRMGFASFEVQNHERNHGPILDNTGAEVGWLLPHNRSAQPYDYDLDQWRDNLTNKYNLQKDHTGAIIKCEAKQDNSLYFNVKGELLPCCYHGVDQHIHPQGTTLQEQIDSYRWLEDTWGKKDCNETCYSACKR